MQFVDFQIRAWLETEERARVLVHSSPAGEMRRPVSVPMIPEALERLREQFGRHYWVSGDPTVRTKTIELGQQLSQTLLPTPVFLLMLRSLERLGPGQGLRLRLCLDPSLTDVPWEFLYRPDVTEPDSRFGFLVLDSRISMIREAPTNSDPIPLSQGQQRLVFAGTYWAGKNGVPEDRWDIRSEYEATESELKRLKDLLAVELYDASSESFQNSFLQPVAMFHYSGHTDVDDGRGYLARKMDSDPNRVSSRMYSEELALLLRKAQTRVGVFSACNSGQWVFVEPLLREHGLRALVGVHDYVSTVGAIAFTKKLYYALAVGLSLDEAVTRARLQLDVENPDPEQKGRTSYEWGAFKVFMNSAEPVLLPQPDRPEVREGRQRVQDERRQTTTDVRRATRMAFRRFYDFVLVADDVRRKDGNGFVEGFTVHVFNSPAGEGERKEQVTVPDFSQQLRFLEDRTYDSKVEKQIELGQTLADLLLPPYTRTLFRQSLTRIRDDEGLRLRLRLDDALADFPWEYMHIQYTRGERVSSSFLALDPQISIVRHEALALPADGSDIPGDFHETPARRRVVVAMATPPSYAPLLNLPDEQKAIRGALAAVPGIEATYIPEYTAEHYDRIPSATLEDVFSALRQRADIFHFSGHGEFAAQMGPVLGSKVGTGGIVLASAAGDALPVAADRFAEILRGKGVRLVVLGACQTARRDGRHVWSGVAPALLRVGIPAVVAMQFKIRDDVAAPFIGTMYQALVEGRDIDEAVGLGRAAIRIKALGSTQPDLRDWGVPVLYLRSSRGGVIPR